MEANGSGRSTSELTGTHHSRRSRSLQVCFRVERLVKEHGG